MILDIKKYVKPLAGQKEPNHTHKLERGLDKSFKSSPSFIKIAEFY